MSTYNKKIIIFSTNDNIISIPLVHHIVSQKKYRKFKFDIFFVESKLIRKIKVLITIILFGSIIELIKRIIDRAEVRISTAIVKPIDIYPKD